MMKIVFISSLYPPEIMGGAEIVVKNIATELIKRGHEVIIITTGRETKIEDLGNIKIYRLKLNLYFLLEFTSQHISKRLLWQVVDLLNVEAYRKIRRILEAESPDIVHMHNFKGLSPLSFKAVKDSGIPLVFTAHDYSPICLRSNLLNGKSEICHGGNIACSSYNKIQKTIISDKPDAVTAPSKFVLDKLESEGLFRDAEKIVLPNPIEGERKPCEKTYDVIDILFVGSLSKHKGPDILIKSFRKVEGDNLRLRIAGKGPMEDELRKLAKGDDRIIFHGFLAGDELESLYRMANLTILPSICFEAFGMVILESFMNSTPVIASRIGGIPELVRDGYNGFLFEPGNSHELCILIKKILDDPSILRELENGAYESTSLYDIDMIIDQLLDIYRVYMG
ncbi:glycosyltransferase family 4 protein [Methanothermobacter sp. THM-2]|nr:glycosyltransferase family 4 protein [Methanothermobacter sp. THM-2]